LTAYDGRANDQQLAVDRLRQAVEDTIGKTAASVEVVASMASTIENVVKGVERQADATAKNADALQPDTPPVEGCSGAGGESREFGTTAGGSEEAGDEVPGLGPALSAGLDDAECCGVAA